MMLKHLKSTTEKNISSFPKRYVIALKANFSLYEQLVITLQKCCSAIVSLVTQGKGENGENRG